MVSKHLKRCPTSVNREMYIKNHNGETTIFLLERLKLKRLTVPSADKEYGKQLKS